MEEYIVLVRDGVIGHDTTNYILLDPNKCNLKSILELGTTEVKRFNVGGIPSERIVKLFDVVKFYRESKEKPTEEELVNQLGRVIQK